MVLLINKANVSAILQVAIGYSEADFDVFIREAQDFDLKPLLCDEFYYELLQKKDDPKWKKLIDGGTYVKNGIDFHFRGLGDVLAYFTYARFIRKSNNVSTSHGFTQKTTPHSMPLPIEEKNNMYYKYKQDAHVIFSDFQKYIEGRTIDYPSWAGCRTNCGTTIRNTGFKTYVIK